MEYNKSMIYIRMLVDVTWYSIKDHVVECYTRDEDRPHLQEHFFLLLRKGKEAYYENVRSLMALDSFDNITCPMEDKDLFTFRLPDCYHHDLDMFRQGYYSKMSKKAKDTILFSHYDHKGNLMESGRYIHMVLYPNEEHRRALCHTLGIRYGVDMPVDAEIRSKPDEREETFSLEWIQEQELNM